MRCCRSPSTATSSTAGSLAYIVRVPTPEPSGEPRSRRRCPGPADRPSACHSVESVEPDARPHGRRRELPTSPTTTTGPHPFSITIVDGGEAVESYDDLTLGGPRDAATVINKTSTRVKVAVELADDVDLDEPARAAQARRLRAGAGGRQAGPGQRPASSRARSPPGPASRGLAIAEDVTSSRSRTWSPPRPRRTAASTWGSGRPCRRASSRTASSTPTGWPSSTRPPGLTPQAVKDWRDRHGAVRLRVRDALLPVDQGREPDRPNGNCEILVPPSGHVAGVWARTDESRGVWKAPANDTSAASLDVERIDHAGRAGRAQPEGHQRDPRRSASRGIRIWGARTLSSDSDWRYVNVRRLFNMIEATIVEGTQWAVFEPNDVALWDGRQAHDQRRSCAVLWRPGRTVGAHRGGGVLRPLRLGDTIPAPSRRRREAHRRGRHRPRQAGGVRRSSASARTSRPRPERVPSRP